MSVKVLSAIMISALLAYCTSKAVSLQYQWADELVKILFGLKNDNVELFFSSFSSQIFEITLISSALFFGYFRSYFKGPKWWRALAPISYCVSLCCYLLVFSFQAGVLTVAGIWQILCDLSIGFKTLNSLPDLLFFFLGLMARAMAFCLSVKLGEFLYESLSSRNKPMKLIAPAFIALIVPAVLNDCFGYSMSWQQGLLFDFVIVMMASFLAACACKFTQLSRILSVITFTNLPFLLFNLSNFLSFLLYASQNHFLPFLLSSISIYVVTVSAAITGGLASRIFLKTTFAEPIPRSFLTNAED
ncbi:MAG: hypothetical protein K2Y32_17915 [Candidatus Obscuribacterales bacterium]|nr:hypothetical protein [Candidatus Obscuribacterales bacterium]